ncbi:MAG: PxKF domain-containing protein [bacterium]|nr:PxKF domain-containing protein [bacterium]
MVNVMKILRGKLFAVLVLLGVAIVVLSFVRPARSKITDPVMAQTLGGTEQSTPEEHSVWAQTFQVTTPGMPTTLNLTGDVNIGYPEDPTAIVVIYDVASPADASESNLIAQSTNIGDCGFGPGHYCWEFIFADPSPTLIPGHTYTWIFYGHVVQGYIHKFFELSPDTVGGQGYYLSDTGTWLPTVLPNIGFDLHGILSVPPEMSALQQFSSDGVTPLAEGSISQNTGVVFGATLQEVSADTLQLQVEYTTGAFTGNPNAMSGPVAPGSQATVAVEGLADGTYHWAARGYDLVTGMTSPWVEFGVPGNTDFVIRTTQIVFNPPFTPGENVCIGKVVPLKFQVTDPSGQLLTDHQAQLFVAKIENNVPGLDVVPLPNPGADGNYFRTQQHQYIYNFDTSSLSAGLWQLKIVLDDGNVSTAPFSLESCKKK